MEASPPSPSTTTASTITTKEYVPGYIESAEVFVTDGLHAGKRGTIAAVCPKSCRVACDGEITGNVPYRHVRLVKTAPPAPPGQTKLVKKKEEEGKWSPPLSSSSEDEEDAKSFVSADTLPAAEAAASPPSPPPSPWPVIPLSLPVAFPISKRISALVQEEKDQLATGHVPTPKPSTTVLKVVEQAAAEIEHLRRMEHALGPYLEQDPSSPDFCRIRRVTTRTGQYSAVQVDHVLPKAWGGADALHNYVLMPTELNHALSDDMTERKRDAVVTTCRKAWTGARKFAAEVAERCTKRANVE
jgi:hypothetical protein